MITINDIIVSTAERMWYVTILSLIQLKTVK